MAPLESDTVGKPAGDPASASSTKRERTPIRVIIVDDDQMVAQMMRLRLEHVGGIEVLGLAGDGPAALRLIRQQRPDVLILDLFLPGMSGVEVAQRVRAAFPEVAILVVTGYYHVWPPRPLLELGVRGYLPKTASLEALVAAVRAVAQGQIVVAPDLLGAALTRPAALLTPREQAVLQLLAAGQHTAEIAAALSVSPRTVELHITHLLAKLHARSRAEAVLKALQQGLLLPQTSDN
jgi:DNA-binding NarL/FixJ family response regulator